MVSPQNNFGYQTKLKQSNALQWSQTTRTIRDIHESSKPTELTQNKLKASSGCKTGKNTSKQPARRVKLPIYWPISMILQEKSRIFY